MEEGHDTRIADVRRSYLPRLLIIPDRFGECCSGDFEVRFLDLPRLSLPSQDSVDVALV